MRFPISSSRGLAMAVPLACVALAVQAQGPDGVVTLDPHRRFRDAPRRARVRRPGVGRHDRAATLHNGQPQVNLSETLSRMPGVFAANRQNYAQDLQISSRGFGARAAFGVRGVRLYQDGIPVTMPDGQGQTGSFSLLSAQRIEVLRGPFSALYGNASGGVISVFTEDPPAAPLATMTGGGGSYGTRNVRREARRRDAARQAASSPRANSSPTAIAITRRRDATLTNAKLVLERDAGDARHADRQHAVPAGDAGPARPDACAMGTRIRAAWTRRRCSSTRARRSTRRRGASRWTRTQRRWQLTWRRIRRAGAISAQYLALVRRRADVVRAASSTRPRLRRRGARLTWRGAGVRPSARRDVAARRMRPAARARKGYVNNNGEAGRPAPRRGRHRQADAMRTRRPNGLCAGVVGHRRHAHEPRALRVGRSLHHCGRIRTTAAAGVRRHEPGVRRRVHANDLNAVRELRRGLRDADLRGARVSHRGTGLNFGLRPATSRATEIGVRHSGRAAHRIDRGTVQRRYGKRDRHRCRDRRPHERQECGRHAPDGRRSRVGSAAIATACSAHVALTWLRAEFADVFTTGSPPITVTDERLPAVPARQAYGELAWAPVGSRLSAALEAQYVDKLYVNDRNADAAPAYAVMNARIGLAQTMGAATLRGYARLEQPVRSQLSGVGDHQRYERPVFRAGTGSQLVRGRQRRRTPLTR